MCSVGSGSGRRSRASIVTTRNPSLPAVPTQTRHHHEAGVASNGRANRLLHAVHQGVSSARRQLQEPTDGIACDAGWQLVGVLRHGFVDAEFAHDGAPRCFGLQLLGVLPQRMCWHGARCPSLPLGLARRAARAAARAARFFSASRPRGSRLCAHGSRGCACER